MSDLHFVSLQVLRDLAPHVWHRVMHTDITVYRLSLTSPKLPDSTPIVNLRYCNPAFLLRGQHHPHDVVPVTAISLPTVQEWIPLSHIITLCRASSMLLSGPASVAFCTTAPAIISDAAGKADMDSCKTMSPERRFTPRRVVY